MKGDVRGQSNVIIIVLLILIVLAAIVIIWNVVFGIINKSTSQVSNPDIFSTQLIIKSVQLGVDSANVSISRIGTGEITALKFVFTDDSGNNYIRDVTIGILGPSETLTYSFNNITNNNVTFVKVSVIPVFGKDLGIGDESGVGGNSYSGVSGGTSNSSNSSSYFIKFENVVFNSAGNGNVSINISRGTDNSSASLTSILFTFYDKDGLLVNSTTINSGMPLVSQSAVYTFVISLNSFSNITNITQVQATPFISGVAASSLIAITNTSGLIDSNNGLISKWQFNGNANDNFGNNHGTLINGAQVINGALVLNGNSQFVDIGDKPDYGLNTSGAVSAWARIDKNKTYSGIFSLSSLGGASVNVRGDLVIVNVTASRFRYYLGNATGFYIVTASDRDAGFDNWYFLTASWNTTILSFYVNGNLDTRYQSPPRYQDSNFPWLIGKVFNDNVTTLNGSIDDVRIYNRTLTDSEVSVLYALQRK